MKTVRLSIESLRSTSNNRPEGYFERVVQMGVPDGQFIILSADDYLSLVAEFSPSNHGQIKRQVSALVDASPKDSWPAWAKAISILSKEDDRGLGDTIARVIGPVGGDAFKKWAESIGLNCGCNDRQIYLNTRFPLK